MSPRACGLTVGHTGSEDISEIFYGRIGQVLIETVFIFSLLEFNLIIFAMLPDYPQCCCVLWSASVILMNLYDAI